MCSSPCAEWLATEAQHLIESALFGAGRKLFLVPARQALRSCHDANSIARGLFHARVDLGVADRFRACRGAAAKPKFGIRPLRDRYR